MEVLNNYRIADEFSKMISEYIVDNGYFKLSLDGINIEYLRLQSEHYAAERNEFIKRYNDIITEHGIDAYVSMQQFFAKRIAGTLNNSGNVTGRLIKLNKLYNRGDGTYEIVCKPTWGESIDLLGVILVDKESVDQVIFTALELIGDFKEMVHAYAYLNSDAYTPMKATEQPVVNTLSNAAPIVPKTKKDTGYKKLYWDRPERQLKELFLKLGEESIGAAPPLAASEDEILRMVEENFTFAETDESIAEPKQKIKINCSHASLVRLLLYLTTKRNAEDKVMPPLRTKDLVNFIRSVFTSKEGNSINRGSISSTISRAEKKKLHGEDIFKIDEELNGEASIFTLIGSQLGQIWHKRTSPVSHY